MDNWESLWQKLRIRVMRRHDYFEKEYTADNMQADAAELGAYRWVYQMMKELEERVLLQKAQKMAKSRPTVTPKTRD